jgi:prolyl-tRNA synthetase
VLDFFGSSEADGKGKAQRPAGFAHVHVADDPAVTALLDPLKVTVRCIPMEGADEPGTCVVTGQPVARRSVLARAY